MMQMSWDMMREVIVMLTVLMWHMLRVLCAESRVAVSTTSEEYVVVFCKLFSGCVPKTAFGVIHIARPLWSN